MDIVERLKQGLVLYSSVLENPDKHMKLFDDAANEITRLRSENEALREDKERLDGCIHEINMWRQAYPVSVFPEPDLKKSHELLKAGGQTLDAVSAASFRHVLEGVGKIIDKARESE